MKIEVRNNCSDFNSYRAARVKSLFNAESGCNFSLDAELPIDDPDWKIGLIVGPSGSGKTSMGRLVLGDDALDERLAGAREVAASHQAGVEGVQDRAAGLADLEGAEGRVDGPPDVPEVAFPGGHVPPGCRHVLVEQLGHGDIRVRLPPGLGHREQLAELDLRGPLGVTFLCVKGHMTEGAMQQIGPLLAPDGYILSLQNGLNEAVIARHVGEQRTVGAFVHFGADLMEPGMIQLGAEQTIFIGELDGRVTPRAEALRETLSHVMPAQVTTNIWGFLWGKLVYGAMAFACSTVIGMSD